MSLPLLAKRQSLFYTHGRHLFISPPSVCSPQCQGRLQCQGGISHQLQIYGISLPLFSIPPSHLDTCLCPSHSQIPSALPPSLSLSLLAPLQEKVLASNLRESCPSILDSISHAPTKSIVRSISSYHAKSDVSCHRSSILLLPTKFQSSCTSFWRSPRFQLAKKLTTLECDTQFRAFSTSDSEGDRETDDAFEVEDVQHDNQGTEFPHKSSADPEEITRVAKVIDELFALDRNMEAVLDECGINLTHDLVVDVLQRFKHARKPAFRFFCWAGQKPGFSHDSRTYNVMLMILGKTRQFETLGSLLEEMGERGLLTTGSFAIAIKAFASGKERKKAIGVFDLMKKYGFKAGVDTINCLLDALAREKLAKEAQALYDKLKSRFAPNMKTYTVLLSGWCRVKNLMEAGNIWNEMVDLGFKPDIITHNIMLDGLLKVKKKSDAIKLFEVMKAKGPAPNVRSYTILMRDLCKHNRTTEAVSYFDEMLASGCEPDAGVYTCLITGFGNEKKMDMVFSLLKEMKKKGYSPDARLYNALIKLMANRRMPDDAVRIYKKMIKSGIQPTIHTYNMMMKSYFFVGNSEMGCAVWDEMIQRGCCPDDNSYIVLIGGLIRHGRSEEACKHIEEMINKGMKVPQLDFSKFVADFSRVGRPNILEELARKTRLAGKHEVSEALASWAETTQKRTPRRGPVDIDG
uniref:Pentacotripeptide-repeat region of PRORP domain-containing protein n=1 Tax=Opuntia streptacantha TaxID=393608 RepID=A0A7C9FLK3_OPUST